MARRKKHEEHVNAEAWAIPYGDLVTLLMALFVVLYATASINEGKYRVVSESLSRAFKGSPRSDKPIPVGQPSKAGILGAENQAMIDTRVGKTGAADARQTPKDSTRAGNKADGSRLKDRFEDATGKEEQVKLEKMADDVERALKDYIDSRLIMVRRTDFWIEVEISTDILFGSGSAGIATAARPILRSVAEILAPFPNAIRIEGHTDNIPISTAVFPSNWELSAARAASVVHLFQKVGVPPRRMSVLGYGEHRPRFDNSIPEGRDANRRVVVVVMAMPAEGGEDDRNADAGRDAASQLETSSPEPPPVRGAARSLQEQG